MQRPSGAILSAPPASADEIPADTEVAHGPVIETVLAPSKGWIGINWTELFHTRELLYFLVWRDIKVRYKQAVLGASWVVLQPLFNMIVFTLVFGKAAGFDKILGNEWAQKYPVFVFAALLPWQLFATSLTSGGMSLLSQTNLITKIYFPRLYVPTSVVGGAMLDMSISMLFLIGLMAGYRVAPSPAVLLLPLLLVLTAACSLSVAYLFSALTITYRDFRFLIPFISQAWMWASFVAFPVFSSIGPRMRMILMLNPMYGIIATWRKLLLGGAPDQITGWSPLYLVCSIIVTSGLLLLGMFYFRRTERRFADIA